MGSITRSDCIDVIKATSGTVIVVFGGWQIFRLCQDWIKGIRKGKQEQELQARLDEFAKISRSHECRNMIILHRFPPSVNVPNPSGFGLKLESFVRLANLQYEVDFSMPKGVNEKSPWITVNGEHFHDSQRIVEMFERMKGNRIGHYSDEQLAVAAAARILVEEHLYWGLVLWRYVYNKGSNLHEIFPNLSPQELEVFRKNCCEKYKTFTWYQGLGRHDPELLNHFMTNDLKTISLLLGSKPYLLGDQPCTDDCAIFGMLAQAIWADVGSPLEDIIKKNFPNLVAYCVRMKELIWPDWDACLHQDPEASKGPRKVVFCESSNDGSVASGTSPLKLETDQPEPVVITIPYDEETQEGTEAEGPQLTPASNDSSRTGTGDNNNAKLN